MDRPIVALDIDGCVRALVERRMVDPPLAAGVERPQDDFERWLAGPPVDRDEWRAAQPPAVLEAVDSLQPVSLRFRWDQWPTGPRHRAWVLSWGTDDESRALPGSVPFVVDETIDEGWEWSSYVPEEAAVKPVIADGGGFGAARWAPLEIVMPVLVVPWVADWVLSLIRRGVEVVWCTTWTGALPIWEAALGMPELDDALDGADPPESGEDTGTWKLRALRSRFRGQPLILIDDMLPVDVIGATSLPAFGPAGRQTSDRVPFLPVLTTPSTGIRRHDADRVNHWLATLS